LAALKSASNPKDKASLAAALSTLKADTAVGTIDFTAGPVPNCTPTGLVGVQWVKAPEGSNRQFELEIVANADHPTVPLTAQMSAYTLQG
jgi:branched-chain amino acid transport system substrate-binding protein